MGRMNPSPQASVPGLLIGRKSVSLGQTPAGLGGVERGRALQGAPPPSRRQASDPPSSGRAGRAAFSRAGCGEARRSPRFLGRARKAQEPDLLKLESPLRSTPPHRPSARESPLGRTSACSPGRPRLR